MGSTVGLQGNYEQLGHYALKYFVGGWRPTTAKYAFLNI
jgi:hypothetical protein